MDYLHFTNEKTEAWKIFIIPIPTPNTHTHTELVKGSQGTQSGLASWPAKLMLARVMDCEFWKAVDQAFQGSRLS